MNNSIQGAIAPVVFNFNSLSIRTVTDEHDNPWFVATDVCNILGYTNCRQSIKDHCREAGVSKRYIRSSGQNRKITFINEGNLYRLITKSRKPEAEEFEIKLMDEILPTIRKTGGYQHKPNTKPEPEIRYFVGQDGSTKLAAEAAELIKINKQLLKSLSPTKLATINPPVWVRPAKAGTKDAVRDIKAVNAIIIDLKEWTKQLPDEAGNELWEALDDLQKLMVTCWTEVDEAIRCIESGMFYLKRWNG